jgi:hypothetical protein
MVLYKGQRLTVRSDAGIWYIRWEEGHRPKWQRCQSLSDALHQKTRKEIELQAVSVGIDVNMSNPSRLKLAERSGSTLRTRNS